MILGLLILIGIIFLLLYYSNSCDTNKSITIKSLPVCFYDEGVNIHPRRINHSSSSSDKTIFVSIASYRDKDCVNTILDCFQKSKSPQIIRIGVCQQNKDEDMDCILNDKYDQLKPYLNQIRVIRIPFYEAKGPTYARYLCSTLWQNEKYYMQIDSHMRFEKNWDEKVIGIIEKMEPKTVLTTYPQEIDTPSNQVVPVICKLIYNAQDNLFSYPGADLITKPSQPVQTGFVTGGFFFADSSFLKELPYDPRLPDLFLGEEILHSIRFWTHGWDIYAPNENIVYHYYTRESEPKFWEDKRMNNLDAIKKVRNIIGLSNENIPENINYKLDIYGLGNKRSLNDFYRFVGFDFTHKKVSGNFCSNIKK
jgi:[Skp1-protein]-hydroxyproline N-acetylglucosaminyltransferase